METPKKPYVEDWHGFEINGWPWRRGVCIAYCCRVRRGGNDVFAFKGRAAPLDDAEAPPEGRFDAMDAKETALARVRAIIDLRSFTQGETIDRRLFDLNTSSMPPHELRRRLLGVFYTLRQELSLTYNDESIDIVGLSMELGVLDGECIRELEYLLGKGWLRSFWMAPIYRREMAITADGVDEYELHGEPASTIEVFVSYRGADTGRQVQPLGDKLRASLDKDSVFIAPEDIRAGLWREKIWKAISQCRVMLVLIGPCWLTIEGDDGQRRLDAPKDILRLEIETAFDQQKTVIPVLFGAVEMPGVEDLPPSLRRLPECQGYLIDPDRWSADTDKLIRALEVELGRPAAEGM